MRNWNPSSGLLTRDLISEEHSQKLRAAILDLPEANDVLALTRLLRSPVPKPKQSVVQSSTSAAPPSEARP